MAGRRSGHRANVPPEDVATRALLRAGRHSAIPNLGRDTEYTKDFIESRNQRGELDRALTYASIVADLEVLGSCDAIVGTAASWVSRLIFLLIVGNTGRTPPHVFLDQRFGGPADVW